MIKGARSGKAHRAGVHRRFGQRRHLRDIVHARLFAIGTAFAHHEHTQRGVWQLQANIQVELAAGQAVEIFREALPIPRQAVLQDREGQILHAFHQPDQPILILHPTRREAHPAIAGNHRGDTVPRRRLQPLVPGRLPVIMGVHIDETGGDKQAFGVNFLGAAPIDLANGGNAAILDRDIAFEPGAAAPVDNVALADDEIEIAAHLGSVSRRWGNVNLPESATAVPRRPQAPLPARPAPPAAWDRRYPDRR